MKTIKRLLEGLIIAFSMYSRIPMPTVSWSSGGMSCALCFFPAVGVLVGAAMALFSWAAQRLGLNAIARVCVLTVLPLALTGGIHMDGYLDTVDARSSYGDRLKRLEILKDPHTGAFAVIGCSRYLLLYAAVWSLIRPEHALAAGGIYVMERAVSGWSVVCFPKAKEEGLASTFSARSRKGLVTGFLAAWWLAGFFWLAWQGSPAMAAAAAAAELAAAMWYRHVARKEFGGITGDLAGYFLQLAELAMTGVLIFF